MGERDIYAKLEVDTRGAMMGDGNVDCKTLELMGAENRGGRGIKHWN